MIQSLPEGCIAKVLSFTSPRDACRLAAVSPLFKSASESDCVWDAFLPQDYESIALSSADPSFLRLLPSKKLLYFSLCDSPILIEDGRKSFSLSKLSGRKCYMLSSSELSIAWGNDRDYWEWRPMADSRFSTVAELLYVWWFDMNSTIKISMLSPSTLYRAFLVFRLAEDHDGFQNQPINAEVSIDGQVVSTRTVYLHLCSGRRWRRRIYAMERGDGWMELELGQFVTDEENEGMVGFRIWETSCNSVKGGFICEGIEVRVKEDSTL